MHDTDIQRLDPKTIDRIAAGEVVERPASVVKELVENSLDADATRITVAVQEGGTEGIVVSDDGIGMTETDVRTAVQEHTTSKIRSIEDLESGVGTLGFRGEALHTIGAVSKTTIRTKPRGGSDGTELVYEGGEVEAVQPAGCPEGTTIEVEDLFYNTPARRKYLKTRATEFSHVNRVVTRYALANPDVAVTLQHDGREVFATTGQGNLRSTVMNVYGKEVAKAMQPVDSAAEDDPRDTPLDSVSGLVSHPETTRSTREYVSTFINGRYVTSKLVRDAVLDAYGGQLASDRYPFVVLFLEMPAVEVDVNVHPRKMEVRFSEEAGVRRQVRDAVEDALLDAGLLRSSAPRGKSKAPEADVRPEAGGESMSGGESATADESESSTDDEQASDDDGSAETTAGVADATETAEDRYADEGWLPPEEREAEGSDEAGESASDADGPAGSKSAASDGEEPPSTANAGQRREQVSRPDHEALGDFGPTGGDLDDLGGSENEAATEPTATPDSSRKFSGEQTQTTLSGEDARDRGEYETLPSLDVLGQYRETYLVAEGPDGLVLVDQHAADERVNYERLKETFADGVTAQALAAPVELELTAGEAAAFPDYKDALARLGFQAEASDDRSVTVTAVPAVFRKTLDPEDVRDVLAGFVAEEADGSETVEELADAFIADLACYPSITGNTSLTEGSVVDLLTELDACENPWACPHGRPTVVQFGSEEIENRFERDYPGHGGRRDR
ncbi:DNA mismatch repair endonuclease MutL [Haloarchaeobius sp. HME9146]|uniref:DNA mismatch repair endonuclease MutL n=1 Tax=Haloarchaeobius sp. HME9146 TaxID=2978732 RepID=UPI0021BF7BB8|nr:DNA mismatch repair endonuclease MutL [Haloarchaeobius sp. HME9146]MCT9095540.1 DNA mismatch repair endonuclease MutL [Haloarchaeobius sp. HME9146]